MVAVLLTVTGGSAYLGAAVVARHRAQGAADLAALAAAARVPGGAESACAQATAVARAMRAGVTGCVVDDLDVVITIEVGVARAMGHCPGGRPRRPGLVAAGRPAAISAGVGSRTETRPANASSSSSTRLTVT